MPLMPIDRVVRCPRCKSKLSQSDNNAYVCSNAPCLYSTQPFPIMDGVPVLVDFEDSILDREWIIRKHGESLKARPNRSRGWRKVLRKLLTSKSATAGNSQRFVTELKGLATRPRLLIIGGGTVDGGSREFYKDAEIDLISLDIYRSGSTNLVADGHSLPLENESVHGVWIMAVLEHVLDPWRVVSEIHRVLAKDGIVYSDTPFMQHIHEGAYDFTRFTLSGHRWLFRNFEHISSGVTRGPGTMMIWAIRYFVGAIFRSYRMGTLATIPFFWVRYADNIANSAFPVDSASGSWFFGRKSASPMKPKDIVQFYRGAQRS